MRPFVINLKRSEARNFQRELNPNDNVWISIHEPDNTHIKNEYLDQLPNLKVNFWDLTFPVIDVKTGERIFPPNERDIEPIVDFLLAHKNKNVYVNCAAGKCRSGAVAQFLNELWGYEWPEEFKSRARPNKLILESLIKLYVTKTAS